jgi:hypothetical protein
MAEALAMLYGKSRVPGLPDVSMCLDTERIAIVQMIACLRELNKVQSYGGS